MVISSLNNQRVNVVFGDGAAYHQQHIIGDLPCLEGFGQTGDQPHVGAGQDTDSDDVDVLLQCRLGYRSGVTRMPM